ncbi:MAG: chromate transporter [Butyrivibrio sp.]|nr:chromate transporter [Butyrivibrio sp.]
MIYLDLLIGFLEVGFFSFGGAYAAIPLIRDVVQSRGWLDDEMLSYMIAISESTPGPIMVNMATYVGSLKGGILGAAIATSAVVLPAFLIIILIMVVLKKLLQNKFVNAALSGLKPCIIGIILSTGIMLVIKNCEISSSETMNVPAICLTAVMAFIYFGSRKLLKNGISPIMLICISAVVGIIAYGI